jgi:DNA polymerase-3 subunit beta
MKFTIERDALHAALSAVHSQTRAKLNIPILQHVLVDAPAGGQVTLTGNCLASSCCYTVPAKIADAGAIALPADRFDRLVSGCAEGSLIVVEANEKTAIIRYGKARYTLPILPASDFPPMPAHDATATFDLSSIEVSRLFKVPVSFAEGPKGSRENLRGVFLHPSEKGILAVASDGQVLAEDMIEVCATFDGVIVPPEAANEIASFGKAGDIHIEVSPVLLSVESGPRRFITKLIDATFPTDYARWIPTQSDTPFALKVAEMRAALERLMATYDPESRAVVRLKWKEGDEWLTLSMQTSCGAGEEQIECAVGRKAPGEVGFQVDNLKRMLNAAQGSDIVLHVYGPGDPMRFGFPDNPNFRGIVLPCR